MKESIAEGGYSCLYLNYIRAIILQFSLENVRSKDKPEVENDIDTQTFTVQLRKKNPEERGGKLLSKNNK